MLLQHDADGLEQPAVDDSLHGGEVVVAQVDDSAQYAQADVERSLHLLLPSASTLSSSFAAADDTAAAPDYLSPSIQLPK